MKIFLIHIALAYCCALVLQAQEQRTTYYDHAKQQVKEQYYLRSASSQILEGPYTSYHLNGKVESRGQFSNNVTTGMWEFFYESGALKMRGNLRNSSNFGLWEYFYENGNKSMEGEIINRNREGIWKLYYESGELRETGNYASNLRSGPWKYYYENGKLKAEANYVADEGSKREYYPSGKLKGEGPMIANKKSGFWQYYDEAQGKLQMQGSYVDGKKTGIWKSYYPTGRLAAEGLWLNDQPSGEWLYYFEEGGLSMRGTYLGGQKEGLWTSFFAGGTKKSETVFNKGTGEYREFYKTGQLKVVGHIFNNKNEGRWEYYYTSGKLEGICEFVNGAGEYTGYYEDGVIQTQGKIEDDRRVGTWKLFDREGNLSGYYRPFYDDNIRLKPIASGRSANNEGKGFNYFATQPNEFRGVIISLSPFTTFLGTLPIGIEFFNDERLGHEFEFESIRNPFYTNDANIDLNTVYTRGYSIALKQKFYNSMAGKSQWYFGHEIRLVNLSHFNNITLPMFPNTQIKASATEQRAEYGLILGLRVFQRTKSKGLTCDLFAGYNVGVRGFQVDELFQPAFEEINQKRFSNTYRFGINIGYLFTSEKR